MMIRKTILIFVTILMVISCKKEDDQPIIESISETVLAPCELPENFFCVNYTDTVRYIGNFISNTPDLPYENCHYYVRLKTNSPDSKTHLYFREEPKSGIYKPAIAMVLDSDTTFAIRHEMGGFNYIPFPTNDVVYINNQNGEITVSYCTVYFMLDFSSMNIIPFSSKLKFNK